MMNDPAMRDIVEKIQLEVADRLRQQEANEEYKNSVETLFQQIQSVPHVLSELLQNADDADATEAMVVFDGRRFQFSHNGADFTEGQLGALCAFSVSTKRTMATTGFRGIGFKSAFSLGDSVCLTSPSLKIRFDREKFTYPKWDDGLPAPDAGRISIEMDVREESRAELEGSIGYWRKTPSSLLFFRKLKRLELAGTILEVRKKSRNGACEFAIMSGGSTKWEGTLISSPPFQLRDEAKREINKLRRVRGDTEFPDVRVDLLLAKRDAGRFYSVLPAGASAPLPFACNAPFVLPPDRHHIESPSQSPTNRHLLEKAGELLARYVLGTVNQRGNDPKGAISTYGWLPLAAEGAEESPETSAARCLADACFERLDGQTWLITADNQLARTSEKPRVIPDALHSVWSPENLQTIFAPGQPIAHPDLPKGVVEHFVRKDWVKPVDAAAVQAALRDGSIPKPQTAAQLWNLWSYVLDLARKENSYFKYQPSLPAEAKGLRLIPVEGSDELKAIEAVVRLSEEASAAIAATDISINEIGVWKLDQACLVSSSSESDSNPDADLFLKLVGLAEAQRSTTIADKLWTNFKERSAGKWTAEVLQRMFVLFFRLECALPRDFLIQRKDGKWRTLEQPLLLPPRDEWIWSIPPAWQDERVINPSWVTSADGTPDNSKIAWLEKTKCACRVPLPHKADRQFCAPWVFVPSRGAAALGGGFLNGTYSYDDFVFEPVLVEFWKQQGATQPDYWARLLEVMLSSAGERLASMTKATLFRRHGPNTSEVGLSGILRAGWIETLRATPCVRSEAGFATQPSAVYCSTPATKFMVQAGMPTLSSNLEQLNQGGILALLGCRIGLPAVAEIRGLWKKLILEEPVSFDHVLAVFYAGEAQWGQTPDGSEKTDLLQFLGEARAIPTHRRTLASAAELVVDAGDNDDALAVLPDLRRTKIIAALNIPQSPDRQADIDWLGSLAADEPLDGAEQRRLRRVFRHPANIEFAFVDLRRWASLDGKWRRLADLKFRIGKKQGEDLVADEITDGGLRGTTTDFTYLDEGQILPSMIGFAPDLRQKAQRELKVGEQTCVRGERPGWLGAIAQVAWTAARDEGDDTVRRRFEDFAFRLRRTEILCHTNLAVVFLLDGQEISKARSIPVCWKDTKLHIALPSPKRILKVGSKIAQELRNDLGPCAFRDEIPTWIDRDRETVIAAAETYLGGGLRPWPDELARGRDEEPDVTEELQGVVEMPPETEEKAEVQVPREMGRTENTSSASSLGEEQNGANRADLQNDEAPPRPRDSPPARPKRQGGRLISYVQHDAEGKEDGERDDATKRLGDVAEGRVCEFETRQGRVPTHLGGNNPGYDIESVEGDRSGKRFIEVKGLSGQWGETGVTLSVRQMDEARARGADYWLYVVENCATSDFKIHRIQDPAGKIDKFGFDLGWIGVAKDTSVGTCAPRISVGDCVSVEGKIGTVEAATEVGELRKLTIAFADGSKTFCLDRSAKKSD